MKVGMYYRNSDVRIEERPVPPVGPGDVLIRVVAAGICGSDILEWYRMKRAPLVLGHEIAGEVVQVGPAVKSVGPGDRVFATHHVPCDACRTCLTGHQTACEAFHTVNNFSPGGFAEFLRVSGRTVATGMLRLPEGVSFVEGSFIEPLGTVVRGMRALAPAPGDTVLVIGAGVAGLLMIRLARALGAGRILATDPFPFRRKAAVASGADAAFAPSDSLADEVRKAGGGRSADRVVIAAGSLPAMRQALSCVEKGGRVLIFAVPMPGETLPVDFNPFWRNDITFATSYGAAPLDNLQALELIRAKRVAVADLVTHRLPLDRIGEGFLAAAKGEDCLKVIIEPHGTTS
jgi:L-iditol 2-dehydrogenase